MIQIQQAPLYYFHQLINLGGFEAEWAKFYDRFDNWGEYRPADLSIDRDYHIASYTGYYEGAPTLIQSSLSMQLNLEARYLEAANAIYLGIQSKQEEDQAKYKLRLSKELEAMRINITENPLSQNYSPLRICIERLAELVKPEPAPPILVHEKPAEQPKSFKYKDSNRKRTDEKLADLHSSLIKSNLIDSNTSLPQLKAVFKEKVIAQPVTWTGFNWQLKLFIDAIQDAVTSKAEKWVTAAACFVDKRGKPYTNERLCQVKPPEHKPEAAALVKRIASDFKPNKP